MSFNKAVTPTISHSPSPSSTPPFRFRVLPTSATSTSMSTSASTSTSTDSIATTSSSSSSSSSSPPFSRIGILQSHLITDEDLYEAGSYQEKWRNRAYPIIRNFLWLGPHGLTTRPPHLTRLGITHIVNVTCDEPSAEALHAHYHYLHCPLSDSVTQTLEPFFDAIASFLHHARKTNRVVYVHCSAGISRSCSMILYYLMVHEHLPLHAAYQHVLYCKNDVAPNPGFMKQLGDREQQLFQSRRTIDPESYLIDRLMCDHVELWNVRVSRDKVRSMAEAENWEYERILARLYEQIAEEGESHEMRLT